MPKSKAVHEGQKLSRGVTDDVTLNKAFQLAHSIYRYRDSARKIALEILWEALEAVDVRLLAQHEADRHSPHKPTKVRWTTKQWLQILIYYKSEVYERQQETKPGSLTQEDMIIRYIKHLILNTCRRNSFHISLALGRLLYDYRAAESMAIYDFVFQDPDSSTRKADAYYRSRKNKLIDELANRFEGFLKVIEGLRGEKKFLGQGNSSQFGTLVIDYLTLFTPWETRCELPNQLGNWTPVHELQESQESQIHSLIHPLCFSRIIAMLKFDSPETRLALPRFFLGGDQVDNTTSPDSGDADPLTQEESLEIRKRIAEQQKRRRKFTPRSLALIVDGIETARLDLLQSRQLCINHVGEDTTLIELIGSDEEGDVLVASHVLMTEDEDESLTSEYFNELEGGQRISVTVFHDADRDSGYSLQIKYQESTALRTIGFWLQQVNHRLFDSEALKGSSKMPTLSPKLAIVMLAFIGASALFYLGLRRGPGEDIAQRQAGPVNVASENLRKAKPDQSRQDNLAGGSKPSVPVRKPDPIESNRSERRHGPITREPTERTITSLSEIERIYVEPLGTDNFSHSLRERLIKKLQTISGLTVSKTPDEADTAITGSVRKRGIARNKTSQQTIGNVSMQLVNVAGEPIWRPKTYRGTVEQVAEQIVNDLKQARENTGGPNR